MSDAAEQENQILAFLSELATRLIDGGVTLQAFKGYAEDAFLQAASRKARLRNSRINLSALAAITGLSRGQIRTVAKRLGSGTKGQSDPVSKVIAGWLSDPGFISSTGKPRQLHLSRRKGGFGDLVARYGSDIPPKAMQSELLRRRKAEVSKGRLKLTEKQSGDSRDRSVRMIAEHLTHAIRSPLPAESVSRLNVLGAELTYPSLSKKDKQILRRRALQGLTSLRADLSAMVDAAHALKGKPKLSKKMSKINVLLILHE